MAAIPEFSGTTLDAICRTLADAATRKEVSLLLAQCGLEDRGGNPKWERMLLVLSYRQNQDRCGNNVLAFVCAVLHPSRFGGKSDRFEDFRSAVNFLLAFHGLAVDERGRP